MIHITYLSHVSNPVPVLVPITRILIPDLRKEWKNAAKNITDRKPNTKDNAPQKGVNRKRKHEQNLNHVYKNVSIVLIMINIYTRFISDNFYFDSKYWLFGIILREFFEILIQFYALLIVIWWYKFI